MTRHVANLQKSTSSEANLNTFIENNLVLETRVSVAVPCHAILQEQKVTLVKSDVTTFVWREKWFDLFGLLFWGGGVIYFFFFFCWLNFNFLCNGTLINTTNDWLLPVHNLFLLPSEKRIFRLKLYFYACLSLLTILYWFEHQMRIRNIFVAIIVKIFTTMQ